MNGKMSIAKVAGIGIVGILLGFVGSKFLFRSVFFAVAKAPTYPKFAVIKLKDDATCDFLADGTQYRFPNLKPRYGSAPGDSISWYGQDGRSHHTGSLNFDLYFPSDGTPFTDASGALKSHFSNSDNNSGDSANSAGDYPYDRVIMHTIPGNPAGDVSCSNAKDPGVHIDK